MPGATERVAFTDSVNWWVTWDGADYRRAWNELRQASIRDYKEHDPRVDAPVIYRHNEGANIVFYDSHVEYLKKEAIFVAADYDSDPQNPGMWSVDIRVFNQYRR